MRSCSTPRPPGSTPTPATASSSSARSSSSTTCRPGGCSTPTSIRSARCRRRPLDVHGLSNAFLADKPVFAAVAAEFAAFLGDARLVIHNAAFDISFLNAELGWAGQPSLPWARAVDTLELAKRRFPGASNTLDALCRRFGVDNSGRDKHGALLDSELLAEVYLELMGGRQPDLTLTVVTSGAGSVAGIWIAPPRPRPLAPRLTPAEAEAHAAFIATLGPAALWMVSTPAG